jgi:hypothetical protein
MDCDEIKEKLYQCLKNKDIGFDNRYLKLSAKRRQENINLFKINKSILEECNYKELTYCLEAKFDMNTIDHRKLYKFYEDKFYKTKFNQEEETISGHKIAPQNMKKPNLK